MCVAGQENNELFDVESGRAWKQKNKFSDILHVLERCWCKKETLFASSQQICFFHSDFYDTFPIPHDADGLGRECVTDVESE